MLIVDNRRKTTAGDKGLPKKEVRTKWILRDELNAKHLKPACLNRFNLKLGLRATGDWRFAVRINNIR